MFIVSETNTFSAASNFKAAHCQIFHITRKGPFEFSLNTSPAFPLQKPTTTWYYYQLFITSWVSSNVPKEALFDDKSELRIYWISIYPSVNYMLYAHPLWWLSGFTFLVSLKTNIFLK